MGYKRCPVCKSGVFADMDTCYSCMYKFGSNPELEMRFARPDAVAKGRAVGREQEEEGGSQEEGSRANQHKKEGEESLCVEFLVQLQGFLRDFLLDRQVRVD